MYGSATWQGDDRLKIVEFSDDSGNDRKSNGDERSEEVVNVIVLFQASLLNSHLRQREPLIKYFYNALALLHVTILCAYIADDKFSLLVSPQIHQNCTFVAVLSRKLCLTLL